MRLGVEALEQCPCAVARASRWRLPSPLVMTRAVWPVPPNSARFRPILPSSPHKSNREIDEFSHVDHVVTSAKPSQFEAQLVLRTMKNLDPKIQIKYIDTKNQLADILTKEKFHT